MVNNATKFLAALDQPTPASPDPIRKALKDAIARSFESGSFATLPQGNAELARRLGSIADRSEFGTDFYGQAPGRANPDWMIILVPAAEWSGR